MQKKTNRVKINLRKVLGAFTIWSDHPSRDMSIKIIKNQIKRCTEFKVHQPPKKPPANVILNKL